jgi:hypothetical protein
MSDEKSFLDACKRIVDDLKLITGYFGNQYTVKQMVEWDMDKLLKDKKELLIDIESMKSFIESSKLEAAEIVKQAKIKVSDIEDQSNKKIVEMQKTKMSLAAEIEKLEGQKYSLKKN